MRVHICFLKIINRNIWQRFNIKFFAALGKLQVLSVVISKNLTVQGLWIIGVTKNWKIKKKDVNRKRKNPMKVLENWGIFFSSDNAKTGSQSHCVEISKLLCRKVRRSCHKFVPPWWQCSSPPSAIYQAVKSKGNL